MNKALMETYHIQKEISILNGITQLLWWDMSTNMPQKGTYGRSEQLELIEGVVKKKLRSEELKDAIKEAKKGKLNKKDVIVLNKLEEEIKREIKIPKEFQQTLTKKITQAKNAWRQAREKNDYNVFDNHFQQLIKIKQEQAKYLDPRKQPYEALLEEYEKGMTIQKLDKITNYIKTELLELIKKIQTTTTYKEQKHKPILFAAHKQQIIKTFIIEKMKLPIKKFSLSESIHPFSTIISPNDVRITARGKQKMDSFFDTVHEAGHALYDLGLPKEYENTPIFEGASLGLHESQSLFWELMIGKNKTFLTSFYETNKNNFKEAISFEEFYFQINKINPKSTRLNADEINYCLHIILRYEFERDIFNGTIPLKKLREEWNKRTEEILGRKPTDDTNGILQDVHWSEGDFGYFPSYLIGYIYANQIYDKMKHNIKQFENSVKNEEFDPIINWLRRKIHQKGAMYSAEEIIMKATNKEINPILLINYLKKKYYELYNTN